MTILRRILRGCRRLVQLKGDAPCANAYNEANQRNQPPRLVSPQHRVATVRAKAVHVNKWEEKHWVRKHGLLQGGIPAQEYSGFYTTTGGRRWRGFILETEQEVQPFIFHPPLEDIERFTEHRPCFRPRGKGMYYVHTANVPRSTDEAIVNIETFLNDLEQKARWPKLVVQPVVKVTARVGTCT